MSVSNHDNGMSLAARTAAVATAAAKQLGSVLGFARQTPPPFQVPPSPPTTNATAPPVEGLSGILEESRITEDNKKDKNCGSEEGAATVKDGGSDPGEVSGKEGQVREEKEKKAKKGAGNKAKTYPQRLGEPDCAFYVRTGKCDYGQSCKFNHPPDRFKKTKAQQQGTPASNPVSFANAVREDKECGPVEKPKCKYFASSKGCKYGNACMYSHYIEKVEAKTELNFLGLPIRPGEKECPLYMETGACKDSTNCKYHHPNPTAYGGGDQPLEFASSSNTSQLPDFGNASWGPESTSYGLHPYVGASLPYLQGMPAMHQLLPLNNDWHIYQASIDPHLVHGSGQNLAVAAAEDDCKGNAEVTPVCTYGIMIEGKGGDKHPPASATNVEKEAGGSAKHLPVSNADNAAAKNSGKQTPVSAANDTYKGTGTGKMSTIISSTFEATKGKKEQKQLPSAKPHNLTKSTGNEQFGSVLNYVPKEQEEEQPSVSTHYEGTEGKGTKTVTPFHFVPKGTWNAKQPQIDMLYDDTKEKEFEKQPIEGKGNESTPTKSSGNKSQTTKIKKSEKLSLVASAHHVPKGKAKEEQGPASKDLDFSNGKGNGSNPTKNSGHECQPTKSRKHEKQFTVAGLHYVSKGKANEEQHPTSLNHDVSDCKGNGSNPTKNSGNENQPTKSKNHSPIASVHYVPKGKAEEQQPVSGDLDDSNGKSIKSDPTKYSGIESQPAKSKKNEKHSPVASVHYLPKVKGKEEQHHVSTDYGDSDDKGNGNQISVATPMVSVSVRKKGKHPPVATPLGVTDDVILLNVTKKTEGSQPTQLTALPRRPGQPECPFYLKKGGCKYKSCKFDHPKDPNEVPSSSCVLSPRGLPLRPGNPVCARYSRSGICIYGPICKYDHPLDAITLQTVD